MGDEQRRIGVAQAEVARRLEEGDAEHEAGSMRGEAMKVATALAPGIMPRVMAMAQSVPSTRDMAVERAAICVDSQTACSIESALAREAYQRSEKPGGGKAKTAEDENDTVRTIRIGRNRRR